MSGSGRKFALYAVLEACATRVASRTNGCSLTPEVERTGDEVGADWG